MGAPRLKILFLITKSNWGGAQRYVYDLATSLKQRHDVSVALGGEGRLAELLRAQHILIHAISSLGRDVRLKNEFSSFLECYRLLRRERPDVFHVNSSKAGALGALAGRLARVPHIVFTAHAWAWNEERPWYARVIIALLHWLTVILAHRTIAVSHSIYDQMAGFPFTARRMRVIHLGITPLPLLSRAQARTQFFARFPELAAHNDAVWVATIAELHPIKGIPYLLDAMRLLHTTHPHTVAVIIGTGDEYNALEHAIRDRALTHVVYLAGYIADAATLLSAFDLFVLPSLSEAFGYVLIEAGAASLPVIATNVGGIPDIIGDDGGMLVPPRNASLLADAITSSIDDPSAARVLGLTLEKRVREYFTKERMVDETETLYRDLIS